MKEYFEKIKEFIYENPLITLLFAVSTLFFLVQHYLDFSWDFAAYIINGEYFFHGGNYLEVYRAPMIGLILGILLFLGRIFARYGYIILISILFFYANLKLSGALYEKYFYKYNIDKQTINFLFYIFSLNAFVLVFGLSEGTELLALAFFELFLACFILDRTSGYYLALAFLSRYNFLIFAPFLFFNKDLKKITKNIGLFFLVSFPWLLYNRMKLGNWFMSIADSFYLNVFSRLNMVEIFNPLSLLYVINWFLPFFILGLLVPFVVLIRSGDRKISSYKYEILFVLIFLLFLYDVISIPFKVERYMFNLTLPIAFFSVLGVIFIMKNLKKESTKKFFVFVLFISFIISIILIGNAYFVFNNTESMYKEAAEKIKDLHLENCRILSHHWVPLNYYTNNANNVRFLPYNLSNELTMGEIILIFPNYLTIDDRFTKDELINYPKLTEINNFVIIANENISNMNCFKNGKYISIVMAEPSKINKPCEILSKKFNSENIQKIFLKTCNFVNLNWIS